MPKGDFVESVADLLDAVQCFMGSPADWREAVGTHPKYFVHCQKHSQHYFGLSKFCAFKEMSLADYIAEYRYTTEGTTTQKHISKITNQSWIPLAKVNRTVRHEFKAWFEKFFTSTYDLSQISLISLGTID
jgi:hypothetical protein